MRTDGDFALNGALLGGRDCFLCFVASSLANSRQNFGRDPALEALCGFELGAKDQGVETGLVDAVDRLAATVCVDIGLDEVFGVDVLSDCVARFRVTESATDVKGDKKRVFRCAERAHGHVLE